ncbi:MAG TPA: hypothetical protein VFB19_05045 [Mycobacterium sp.]|nr:hypothetical protein [Mycobacterium sp.]
MSRPRPVSRRSVLIGAAALAALGATAACGSKQSAQTDELQAQLDLAHRDSQMASAAAGPAGAFYAPLLNVVADERAAHAKALSEEIARATGASAASSAPPAVTRSPGATPPPSRDDVTAALRESADSAGKLAANSSGYRAGLLGSIAASCTTSATVPLALKAPAQ